jgi:quercetin dioxygenase-like cupin family protein
MQRLLAVVSAAALSLMPPLAAAQSTSSGVRAREGFAGNLVVLNKGLPQTVAVKYQNWFVPPGATIDDLAGGAGGNLVVEVASGFITAIIDGQRQPKQFGEFFVVPAGHKLQIVTTDRSAILHTLQLGQ